MYLLGQVRTTVFTNLLCQYNLVLSETKLNETQPFYIKKKEFDAVQSLQTVFI